MSEVKKGRGRPRKYTTDEERKAAVKDRRVAYTAITLPRSVAELMWNCVAIKSQEVGIQLTTTQVVQMIIRDWIAKHDPDGSKLEASTFKGKGR